SDLFAAGAQIGQHSVNTQLVDNAHALGGNTQTNKALFCLYPETVVVQVWLEPTLGLDVRVRNMVARDRALTGYLANLRHCLAPKITYAGSQAPEKDAIYTRWPKLRQARTSTGPISGPGGTDSGLHPAALGQ